MVGGGGGGGVYVAVSVFVLVTVVVWPLMTTILMFIMLTEMTVL